MKRYIQFSFIFCLAILFSGTPLSAQVMSVTFKLISKSHEPIPYASVIVARRTDTSQRVIKIADSTGKAVFNLESGKQYSVEVNALNYQSFKRGINVNAHQNNFVWVMEVSANTLQDVTVVSRKPLMKQEDDKTIVEPETLASASSNGFEVLEKVPGLFSDQDGNIYISSTTPAKIFVNGRDLKLSNDDMVTLLKNLPPNSILKIEILRTPSAKYDASGSGGIVNVVLKKGIKIGTTGSVAAGWQQGTYANEYINFSLNNNNGKLSNYITLNLGKRNGFDHLVSNRYFAGDSLLSQNSNTTYPAKSVFTSFGAGYQFNNKWSVNYDGRISYNDFDNLTNNNNTISTTATGQILAYNTGNVSNDGNNIYTSHELSSLYKIDSVGSEWTSDVSYAYSGYGNDQLYSNQYTIPVTALTGGNGTIDNYRNTVIAQSDIKLKLNHNYTFEAGLKTSFLQFDSRTQFYKTEAGNTMADEARTNRFIYKENINAAYAQLSKSIGDVVIKAGARLENTNMNGHQTVPSDTSFSVKRTDAFPYVYISKPVMKIAGFELKAYLVYHRSITRPPYDYLNPFPKYVDQYLSETGNPRLKPQFTQNFEANVSIDERPIIAVGYNDTKDIFSNVIYQSDSSHAVAYKTYDNLGKSKEIYVRALGAIPPGKKYFFVVGMQYNHNLYDGYYDNSPLLYKRGSWTLFTFHNLKLDKKTNITLQGFVRFKGQQQFYDMATFGSLNTSINRKFLKDKLIVTLSGNDIFYTMPVDFTTKVATINAFGSRSNDSRRFGVSLRYNFGFHRKEEKKNMFDDEGIEK